jgi:hypothetical protein
MNIDNNETFLVDQVFASSKSSSKMATIVFKKPSKHINLALCTDRWATSSASTSNRTGNSKIEINSRSIEHTAVMESEISITLPRPSLIILTITQQVL